MNNNFGSGIFDSKNPGTEVIIHRFIRSIGDTPQ